MTCLKGETWRPCAEVTGTKFWAVASRSCSRLVTISCLGFLCKFVITAPMVFSSDCFPFPQTLSRSSASMLISPTPAMSRSRTYFACKCSSDFDDFSPKEGSTGCKVHMTKVMLFYCFVLILMGLPTVWIKRDANFISISKADIEIRFDKECAGFSSWYQDALRQD